MISLITYRFENQYIYNVVEWSTENKHPFYLIESVTFPLWYLQTLLVKKNKHPMSSLYIYIYLQ
jgi:hypothetical protein